MPYMYSFDQKLGKAIVAGFLYFAICLPVFSAAPLFARFFTDRDTIYAGEAFQVTLAIYVTGDTLDPQISIEGLPDPAQLQLYPFQELPIETITLDNHSYEVRKFRAWARASGAGSVSLMPRLNGTFIKTTRSFFFMQESQHPASIPIEPCRLSILPLPETSRPADFSGLVGRFAFSMSPTPLNIALGDLITVTFTIEGDLLPDTYRKPGIRQCPDLKVYELKPVTGETTPARHVFTQTIVPVINSLALIPACSLSFFDTRQMKYKTLTAGPFPIRYHAEHAPDLSVYSPTQTASQAGTPSPVAVSTPASDTHSFWSLLCQRLNQEKPATLIGNNEVQVFLAPSESSKKLFTLKPGASVTIKATHESWLCISSPEGLRGWVPAAAISP